MSGKTFKEVLTRFREIPIPEDFDLLVAIANGGIIPAAPLNLRLNKEVRPLRINLRDECQRPKYDNPKTAGPGLLRREGECGLRAVQRSLLPISMNTLTV